MQTAKIDFSKYINMNNRQPMNALISEENKRKKFIKMSDTKLFEFDNYNEDKKAKIRARFEKEQTRKSDQLINN